MPSVHSDIATPEGFLLLFELHIAVAVKSGAMKTGEQVLAETIKSLPDGVVNKLKTHEHFWRTLHFNIRHHTLDQVARMLADGTILRGPLQ